MFQSVQTPVTLTQKSRQAELTLQQIECSVFQLQFWHTD